MLYWLLFSPGIMPKGKFHVSALIFPWTTFHCIFYKLEKFDPEKNIFDFFFKSQGKAVHCWSTLPHVIKK